MNIICEKDILLEALSNVSRATATKSSMPELEGIHFKALNNKLCLTSYNLEMGIQTEINVNIQQSGEIVLTARLLIDMIKKIDDSQISIKTNEKFLTQIKGGCTEYTILGISPDDFPELPAIQSISNITLKEGKLKSQIDQTLYAVAVTDSKPVHTGSLFDIDNNSLTVVSVDGYRLAMRKESGDINQEASFIIPGKTLSEIAKLIKDEDSENDVNFKVSKKQTLVTIGEYKIISRVIEGDFLDYKSSIPKGSSTNIEISTKEFINSIERTSLLISDRLRSPISINFSNKVAVISCTTSIGKAYDEIPCEIEGNPVELGFNNKYLLDGLRACECDKIRLEINGPLSPMKVVPIEGDSFLFLVLPVRLKND